MRRIGILLAALAALSATGCQQLFTTSLGTGLARPGMPVPASLSAEQASAYAAEVAANRDQALAEALMPAMADLVAANPGNAAILGDAVATAGVATGIEDAFMEAIGTVGIDALLGGSASTTVLAGILAGISVSADDIAVFTALNGSSPGAVAGEGVSATTYALAAAAIVVGGLGSAGIELLMDANPANDPVIPNLAIAQALIADASGYGPWAGDPLIAALQILFTTALP